MIIAQDQRSLLGRLVASRRPPLCVHSLLRLRARALPPCLPITALLYVYIYILHFTDTVLQWSPRKQNAVVVPSAMMVRPPPLPTTYKSISEFGNTFAPKSVRRHY